MSDPASISCVEIERAAVGQPGESAIMVHQHSESGQKLAVLRNEQSNLCQNTGAVGILVVNGQPVAQGDLTEVGSSIEARVSTGDVLAAVVHTIPKLNGVVCVTLGELTAVLQECDAGY